MPLSAGSAEKLVTHRCCCGATHPSIPGAPGLTSRLTHLPVLHKEDVQWVQGAEVEDINVVLHSHLGTGGPSRSLRPGPTSEAQEGPMPCAPDLIRFPHRPSLGAMPFVPSAQASWAHVWPRAGLHTHSTGPDRPTRLPLGWVRVKTRGGVPPDTPGGCSEAPSS